MNLERSTQLQRRAEERMPGGVDSPVRSFRAVGETPRWIERAEGAWMWDVDGNRYLDYIGSWGAALLGHAEPGVVAAVEAAARQGSSFGLSTPRELALAEAVQAAMPMAEMVRFVNSGTEAVMSAIRLARGYTGRTKIIKFSGCYHGHADCLLVNAGSGVATLGLPSSAGVPAAAVADTIALAYNDAAGLRQACARLARELAAVIVEPVAGNMGCVAPEAEFLAALREATRQCGALLIVDEVMTGFRLARGGACQRLGLEPDLVTLGKILGGGLPVGAYAGRAEIMRQVAPVGPVYQAGTLAGNPLAMAAGLATLQRIEAMPGLYRDLEQRGQQLADGLRWAAKRAGAEVQVQQTGSMWTVFFSLRPVRDFADAGRCDTVAFGRFHHAMLEQGVLLPPAQFEAAFLGAAHDDAAIGKTVTAAERAFAS